MRTLWNDRFALPAFPHLAETLHADVAVVGGGITGILTAHALREHSLRVVLLEENRLASGVTAHTAAKITAQHGVFCERLLRDFGLVLARQYVQANLRAVERFRSLVAEHSIACDFSDEASYLYATPGAPSLSRELECAQLLGLPVQPVKPHALPFPVQEALCLPRQAVFSPLPFLAALLPGLTVFEHSPVRDIRGHTVFCDSGSVTAEQIIVATHFPMLARHGLYALRLRQERSCVLALTGAPQLRGMWLSAGPDGLSMHRHGAYLLLSGGARRIGTGREDCLAALRERARQLFPQSHEAYAWSSQDCMTLDGVPYVGPYSSSTPCLNVATGFGRWGMSGSMVAAEALSAQLTGEAYPYVDIFSPARFFPSASLSAFLEGAGYAARGFSRRLFTPAQELSRSIAPGHGGLVRYQGRQYGVYRHTDGTLYAVSPVCPHRGCALFWNDAERVWECPCHGSRFDYTGRRLSEPAVTALKSIALPRRAL